MLPTNTIRYGTDTFSFASILLQLGTEVFNIQNGALNKVGDTPVTDIMFQTYGMSNLTNLTKTIISNNSGLKILAKSSNISGSILLNGTPLPKIITAKNDIIISDNTTRIDNFTLNAVSNGSSNLRIAFSFDSGTTWKSYKSNNLSTVDISNLNNFKTNGMTITEFNSITDWNTIITNKKVRFAYYLEANSTSDSVYTDLLTMQIDMNGIWSLLTQNDYNYYYGAENVLSIELLSNGDYRLTV